VKKVIGKTGGGITVAGVIVATAATAAQAQPVSRDSFFPTASSTARPPHALTMALTTVNVRPGNTLSEIAQDHCGTPQDWTGIYDANTRVIGRDPNLIVAGQQLILSCKTGWAPAPPVQPQVSPQSAYSAPAARTPVTTSDVSTSGMGGFQSCVISRESGGNARAVNPSSGAGGLYQFLPSTWASLGYSGLPEDAPVWEQNEAFQKAYAESGTSPWGPYDGC
jgi:LysM repeat protein